MELEPSSTTAKSTTGARPQAVSRHSGPAAAITRSAASSAGTAVGHDPGEAAGGALVGNAPAVGGPPGVPEGRQQEQQQVGEAEGDHRRASRTFSSSARGGKGGSFRAKRAASRLCTQVAQTSRWWSLSSPDAPAAGRAPRSGPPAGPGPGCGRCPAPARSAVEGGQWWANALRAWCLARLWGRARPPPPEPPARGLPAAAAAGLPRPRGRE